MTSGLIALLDDIAALTKLAAASLDDAAAQAAKAGSKAAGIVIDDAAVTPRYVVGLAADRELPIIRKIAIGSLKNKLLILLPGALLLSYLAPWLIIPILMLGGAYLCFEGYLKVVDLIQPQTIPALTNLPTGKATDLENERVASAIRTDFILSAEIMAIALGTVSTAPIWMQGLSLAVVGIAITVAVYGLVALIVKADDLGISLAQSKRSILSMTGRGLVKGMPIFLQALSLLGMVAMLWVGGGIVVHGLHELGQKLPEQAIHDLAVAVSQSLPVAQSAAAWLIQATISALVGLAIGALFAPLIKRFKPS